MSRGTVDVRGIVTSLRQPLVLDAGMQFATIVMQAVAVAGFWVVAARLQSATEVGVAGSLVAAVVALSYYAQLGLNTSLLRVLPTSSRPRDDVAVAMASVGAVGFVLGLGYVAVVPSLASSLGFLHDSPWYAVAFAVLSSVTAVNLLTDSIFLSLRAVPVNMLINGVTMSVARVGLPFVLAGQGAFGLFAAMGLASALGATLSVLGVLRRVPRDPGPRRPSRELRASLRLTAASYLTSGIDQLPILLLPLVILHAAGPSPYGVYFVCLQVATLMYAALYSIGNSMFAEVSRQPERMSSTSRRSALLMAATVVAGAVVVLPGAPLLLSVFGPHYADNGSQVLQVFALGAAGVAVNYWAMMRMRLWSRLRAMILSQVVCSGVTVSLAMLTVQHGIAWVAASFGLGALAGGIAGLLGSRTAPPEPPLVATATSRSVPSGATS